MLKILRRFLEIVRGNDASEIHTSMSILGEFHDANIRLSWEIVDRIKRINCFLEHGDDKCSGNDGNRD